MIAPQITTRKLGAGCQADFTDGYVVSGGRAHQLRVRGEAVLGFCHANRVVPVAGLFEVSKLLANLLIRNDVLGAIDVASNCTDLVPQRHFVFIEGTELRRLLVDHIDDSLCKIGRTFAAQFPSEKTRCIPH